MHDMNDLEALALDVLTERMPLRRCQQDGCGTPLAQLNPGKYCFHHTEERAKLDLPPALRGSGYDRAADAKGDFSDPFVRRLNTSGRSRF